VIGQIALLCLLAGTYLFVPVMPIRFILAFLFLLRLTALSAQRIIPRYLVVEKEQTTQYALCHRNFNLTYRIRNTGPFPLSYLTVKDELSGLVLLGQQEKVFSLGPFEEKTFSYKVVGDSRGVQMSGPVKLKGFGPFRLFSWEKKIPITQKVIIYPSVYKVNLIQERGISGGSVKISSCLYEDTSSFQSMREYIPGDELRRINWKASARLGKLFTMEYDSTIRFPIHIVLMFTLSEYPQTHRGELIERALETAASLAVCFIGMGQEVSFISTGELTDLTSGERRTLFIPPSRGVGQSAQLLQTLAALQAPKEGLNLIDLLSRRENPLGRGTKYFIVGPPPLSEDISFLFKQKRAGRDMEYFVISPTGSRTMSKKLPGIPTHLIREYGKGLIYEQ
jgi:uncharacterized protein (DUF58 family)